MPPPLSIYPAPVQKLIHRLNTPAKVQRWLKSLEYNKSETMRTIVGVARYKQAHCLEASMAAATILEQHGLPPLILDLESTDGIDHTLFLYHRRGRFGTVGKSRDVGLDGRKPVYRTIRALVQSYIVPYIDDRACLRRYGVLDLRNLQSERWRTSDKNVWYVEEALRNIPHTKLTLSPTLIKTWRKRYLEFKKKYPGRQPNFYPHQENWI